MSLLKSARGHKRTTVTKLLKDVENRLDTLTVVEKEALIARFRKLQVEIESLNDKINAEDWEDDKDDVKLGLSMEACEKYNTQIEVAVSTLINSCRSDEGDRTSIPVNNSRHIGGVSSQHLKLPEAPLPFYSNEKSETLDYFLHTFENVVAKYSLGSYEKFILLKRQLKNEPLILVNSLDISEQSYCHAKELLQKAFSSEITKKFDAIKRLANLKLSYNDSPYEFVGEIRLIQNLFSTLKIDIDSVLQYFIWNSMTTNLQSQLVNISNSNKPTLKEINDNIFKAIDRYNEVGDRIKSRKSFKDQVRTSEQVSGFAANVDFKPKRQFCSLCSSADKRDTSHSIKDCTKYKTPELKRRRLEAIGGCVRCGYQNHIISNCKFDFHKKCFNCDKDHMSYLCIVANAKHNVSGNSSGAGDTVNSSTVWTSAFNINVGSEAILPTFSCMIGNTKIRCMKDTGCQPNFINSGIARELNLNIIHKNYPVTVNGFNESQIYSTNVVRVPLEIGCLSCEVEAICIPEIKTSLVLPGLSKCVQQFKYKGYKLADDFLSVESDCISGIDFMLGSNNPGVLVEAQCTFGKKNVSVYSDTNAGVVIFGNLKNILENIRHLPHFNNDYCDRFISTECIKNTDINLKVSSNYAVVNVKDEFDKVALNKALSEMIQYSLNYDQKIYLEDSTEINKSAVNYALNNCSRNDCGRLVFPLLWDKEVEHLLGRNYNLSRSILLSGMKKYKNDHSKLVMIDDVFKQQVADGIIERVYNLNEFMVSNNYSFLPHMPVFRPDHLTTKVRVVFLSNLCEKIHDQVTMSHNQVINAGPCLNEKISVAVTNLRFGEYMITYDLKKAFLQIALEEKDSNRLLFLWFEDVKNNNFNIIAYKNMRLSFGLRASPTILMLAMFKILCIDTDYDDSQMKSFKLLLYALLYMDNGAYTGSLEDVVWAYENINNVFNPYKFYLQQFMTNVNSLQNDIDRGNSEVTPDSVKLLGLNWHRTSDKLSAVPIHLDSKANTKRLILKSIASQFDMQNFQGPLLNRARIFLHNLQCNKDLDWDVKLNSDLIKDWKLISEQANKSPPILVDRCVGDRKDNYDLIAFSDSSKNIYAVVLYLLNLRTGKVSFLNAKNRLVNKQLELKTIPTLELHAVALGVEMLIDMRDQLSGETCVSPVNIVNLKLFTDSMITLHWINAYGYKLDKMSKLSVFVLNRLESINKLCNTRPVTFSFVDTGSNPADCMTRAISYKVLNKSNYIKGPSFLKDNSYESVFSVRLPNPYANCDSNSIECDANFVANVAVSTDTCIDVTRYSSFNRLVRVQANVIKFIDQLKKTCKMKGKLLNMNTYDEDVNYYNVASQLVLINDQRKHFASVFEFFEHYSSSIKRDIPDLVNKLNLFIDKFGCIRVKAKMNNGFKYPLLLSKNSWIASLIIRDTHVKMAHAGCYTLLSHLRKNYWIHCFFSTVKKVIRDCITCRRLNNRNIKVNQNEYRDERMSPSPEPFKFIYFDHIGPYFINYGRERKKCWLLLITCMWSRAVNLKICDDLSVKSFLKSFQMHIFEYGLPSRAFSDLGSQLTVGAEIIEGYLKEGDFLTFFNENDIKPTKFQHYFKGNSSLGSMVEVLVKSCKKLIFGAIRNNILQRSDFDFIISQTVHLMNKRPIAFQHALRENSNVAVPEAITPELLVKGRTLNTLNIIPALEPDDDSDPTYLPVDDKNSLRKDFNKIRKIQSALVKKYEDEFLQQLIGQSIDKKDRYKPVFHHKLCEGDIVLIKDPYIKVYNYPMAVVKKVYENSLNEVTDVEVYKGKTGENVKRHVTAIIPLLRPDYVSENVSAPNIKDGDPVKQSLPSRKAKQLANQRISDLAGI